MADMMTKQTNLDYFKSDSDSLIVKPCSKKTAKYACENFHYLKKMAAGKSVCHGVYENNIFIGAIVYSEGSNYMIGSPYGLDNIYIYELSRVALHTHSNPVTKIISKSLKLLHNQKPELKLIVSYADPNYNHLGIIYQAGNWIYEGQKRNTYQYMIHGKLVHGRTVFSRYGTSKIKYLRENVDENAKMIYIRGKFKYLYPMTKSLRKEYEYLHKPYPKEIV